jgi:urease accessory protein
MLVHEKAGNIASYKSDKQQDIVLLEWFETNKRIWHKSSANGADISFKCLTGPPQLREGDILFESEDVVIIVDIIPTETMLIYPADDHELVAIAYEIGNKHLPLFFEEGVLMTPFDLPLYRQLQANGSTIKEAMKKLAGPLQTTVIPHSIRLSTVFSSGL